MKPIIRSWITTGSHFWSVLFASSTTAKAQLQHLAMASLFVRRNSRRLCTTGHCKLWAGPAIAAETAECGDRLCEWPCIRQNRNDDCRKHWRAGLCGLYRQQKSGRRLAYVVLCKWRDADLR